jgi:uncharacterized membrane protein YvbJ
MKMKCPQCGFENEESSKFCKNCNVPLSKQDYSEDNNSYIKKRENKNQPFKSILDKVKTETIIFFFMLFCIIALYVVSEDLYIKTVIVISVIVFVVWSLIFI